MVGVGMWVGGDVGGGVRGGVYGQGGVGCVCMVSGGGWGGGGSQGRCITERRKELGRLLAMKTGL